MQGKATFFRHPIHPILVPFPIAFFTGSVVADILYFFTSAGYWTKVAATMIGFGILSALLAAVFGFIDYLTAPMSPRVKQIATNHMLLNLGVTALFVIDFFLRRGNPEAPLGYLLSLAGVVGLAISGWLGGTLAYEERVGVVEEGPPLQHSGLPPASGGQIRR